VAGFFAYQARAARETLLAEKMVRARDLIPFGDFAGGEAAVQEAEGLGAPADWVRWRRGQMAYHLGDFTAAIGLLEGVHGIPAARYLAVRARR
jgi:hypothetical protein